MICDQEFISVGMRKLPGSPGPTALSDALAPLVTALQKEGFPQCCFSHGMKPTSCLGRQAVCEDTAQWAI